MKHLKSVVKLVFVIILCANNLYGQSLIKSIPLNDALLMTTDESGNVYVVSSSNSLLRFNNLGDSSGYYRSVSNGNIGWIDASNPLLVLVYYPDFSKIVLLDKMLSPKMELDLKQKGIFNSPAVAQTDDGNLWVYDNLNATLRKINLQLADLYDCADLRMEIGLVPQPSCIIEGNNNIYMADTTNGIFVFDRYGSYLNTLPFYQLKSLQIKNNQLVYFLNDTLYKYDLKSNQQRVLPWKSSSKIIDIRVERQRLFVLHKTQLEIFEIE